VEVRRATPTGNRSFFLPSAIGKSSPRTPSTSLSSLVHNTDILGALVSLTHATPAFYGLRASEVVIEIFTGHIGLWYRIACPPVSNVRPTYINVSQTKPFPMIIGLG